VSLQSEVTEENISECMCFSSVE